MIRVRIARFIYTFLLIFSGKKFFFNFLLIL
jgi:hypothetical protein